MDLAGDLAVGHPVGHEIENPPFLLGQLCKALVDLRTPLPFRDVRAAPRTPELLDVHAGDRAGDDEALDL